MTHSFARRGRESAALAPGCCSPVSPFRVFGLKETYGSPKFPGNPRDHSPCSTTPARPDLRNGPVVNRSGKASASNQNGGSQRVDDLGAQSHGIWPSCLRLAVEVARHHARLASGLWSHSTGGIRTRRVPMKGFRLSRRPPFLSNLARGSFVTFRTSARSCAGAYAQAAYLPTSWKEACR